MIDNYSPSGPAGVADFAHLLSLTICISYLVCIVLLCSLLHPSYSLVALSCTRSGLGVSHQFNASISQSKCRVVLSLSVCAVFAEGSSLHLGVTLHCTTPVSYVLRVDLSLNLQQHLPRAAAANVQIAKKSPMLLKCHIPVRICLGQSFRNTLQKSYRTVALTLQCSFCCL